MLRAHIVQRFWRLERATANSIQHQNRISALDYGESALITDFPDVAEAAGRGGTERIEKCTVTVVGHARIDLGRLAK